MSITLSPDGLALAETLAVALHTANRLGGYHAGEWSGSYGAIKRAFIETLACEISIAQILYMGESREIAQRIYDEIADNGESVAYNLALFNDGTIELWTVTS